MKPLPPYGRAHLAHIGSSGPWVAVGADAWNFTRPYPVMVLPPGDDPERYSWPVAGRSVVMVRAGAASAAELGRAALALLRCGAVLVAGLNPGGPGPTYYYPEVLHAAA